MVFPVVQIGVIAASNPGSGQAAWAAAATAAYAPLYLWQISYLVRDLRPPKAGWALAAMTAIIAGALPGPATGSAASPSLSRSGPPNSLTTTAFISGARST